MKRQIDRVLTNPNAAFGVLFLGMMLFGPVLASIFVHPLAADAWFAAAKLYSTIAAVFAAVVFVHNRATWLDWLGASAITLQTIVAMLFMVSPFAVRLGWLHPDATNALYTTPLAEGSIAAFGLFAFVCAVGIIRNDWWGYYGEVLLIFSFLALMYFFPTTRATAGVRSELFPGEHVFSGWRDWLLLGFLNWTLINRGRERKRALFQSQVPKTA
jgi:hypothetical protein